MPDLMSNCKPLSSATCTCVNAYYCLPAVTQYESGLPAFETMSGNLGSLTAGDFLNGHRWCEHVIFKKQFEGLHLVLTHHCSSRRWPATSSATARKPKSWAFSGTLTMCC